jgi:hypothetical protein
MACPFSTGCDVGRYFSLHLPETRARCKDLIATIFTKGVRVNIKGTKIEKKGKLIRECFTELVSINLDRFMSWV